VPSGADSAKNVGGGAVDKAKGAVGRIPGLDTGGYIERGGLARLHAGERVVPAAQVDRGGGGGATVNIGKIEASGYEAGRQAARGLKDELDSHGV